MLPPLYILTGGRSTRFGSDKATYRLPDGRPWYEHVMRGLGYGPDQTTLVQPASQARRADHLRTIHDAPENVGPIGALAAALRDADARQESWIALTSCDLVQPTPALIQALLAQQTPAHEACIFRTDRLQPFPGLYRVNLLTKVQAQIQQHVYALNALLNASACAVVAGADNQAPRQANTPGVLARRWKPSDPIG